MSMSNPVKKIEQLIPYLPGKDKDIANKLLSKRDFEGLRDLTWSSLVIAEKKLKLFETPEAIPEKYKNVDLDKPRDLYLVCADYYALLFPEDLIEEIQGEASDLIDDY